jgi:hypothetical protein
LDGLIAEIGDELQALKESDLAKLWQRQEAGENVIERLECAAISDVEEAFQRLGAARDRFRSMVQLHS